MGLLEAGAGLLEALGGLVVRDHLALRADLVSQEQGLAARAGAVVDHRHAGLGLAEAGEQLAAEVHHLQTPGLGLGRVEDGAGLGGLERVGRLRTGPGGDAPDAQGFDHRVALRRRADPEGERGFLVERLEDRAQLTGGGRGVDRLRQPGGEGMCDRGALERVGGFGNVRERP